MRPRAAVAALAAAALALLSSCGGSASAVDGNDPSTGTSSSPSSGPGGPAVQFRVVRTTASSPADSGELQRFSSLDCSHPAATPAAEVMAACDAAGLKYLLEPAAIVGGITSAQAEPTPASQTPGGYVVQIDLDPSAAAVLARLTERLAPTRGLIALVVGGRVISAPTVEAPITTGDLQIALPAGTSAADAQALAARLD